MSPPRSGPAYKRRKSVNQDPPGDGDDTLAYSSLEKRLEMARAKRSRVIAGRDPRDKNETASLAARPAFAMKADAAAPASPENPMPQKQTSARFARATDKTPPAALPTAQGPVQADPQSAPMIKATAAPGWGRLGLITSGCSIGLALGLALGAGLTRGTDPLVSSQPTVASQPVAVATNTAPANPSSPRLELTGITQMAAALPTPAPRPDPVTTAAVPAAPSAAPPSDSAPRPTVSKPFSTFWEVSEPLAPDEIAPITVAWSAMPPPDQIERPQAPGTFDGEARLAPFETAPAPPFSLPEGLFGPGSDLPSAKIFVFAPRTLSENEVNAQVDTLAETGLQTANLQRIAMTISTTHVRYYTASDARVATALAETLGIEARDFTHTPSGEPGHIEVWLAGRSGAMAAPAQTGDAGDTTLIDRIVDIFRPRR